MKHTASALLAATVAAGLATGAASASVTTNASGVVVYDNGTANVYEPFLTTTWAVVCRNCRISEVVSISATMAGAWFGSSQYPAYCVIYDRTDTSFAVQFQANTGECKTLRAYFRQNGNDIEGRADKAGLGNVSYYRSRLPDEVFTQSPATAANNGTYGAFGIQFFGHPTWTVEGFPEVNGKIADLVVSNGTLQVDVLSDTIFTNAISGNGAIVFKGNGKGVNEVTFGSYLKTSYSVVLPDAELSEVEVVSGVICGGWAKSGGEGALPYNVTTNENGSVYAQLQKDMGNNAIKGVSFEIRQNGADVEAKAIKARQAGSNQPLGSDLDDWNGATPSVATSDSAPGYGIALMTFRVHSPARLWLRGPKNWTGGTLVDDLAVHVETNKFPNYVRMRIVDGGSVYLKNALDWNEYPHLVYEVVGDGRLVNVASLGVNQYDQTSLDGGVFENRSSAYANHLDLSGGATMEGSELRLAFRENATWKTTGSETVHIGNDLSTYRESGANVAFTIEANADIKIGGAVSEQSGYRGSRIIKNGAGTATFANTVTMQEGTLELRDGTVAFAANASIHALCVSGDVSVALGDGAAIAFGDSSAVAWESGKIADFTGALGADSRAVRFGTSSAGLTAAQLRQLRANGLRAVLDENGYLHEASAATTIIMR